VFVDKKHRWKRISEKMINAVEEYAKRLDFKQLYIVSDHKWLYEKYWFEKCDIKTDELWRSETIFKRIINENCK
jgi:GNAT superfamily N-acetyltransferase